MKPYFRMNVRRRAGGKTTGARGLATRANIAALACVALVSSLPALAGDPAPAGTAPGLPERRPGLWEISTISPGVGLIRNKVCLKAGDSIVAPTADGRTCAPPNVRIHEGQTIVDITCETKNGQERISTLLTGDFKTWYRAIVKIVYDPPIGSPPNTGVTLDGKYLADACDG